MKTQLSMLFSVYLLKSPWHITHYLICANHVLRIRISVFSSNTLKIQRHKHYFCSKSFSPLINCWSFCCYNDAVSQQPEHVCPYAEVIMTVKCATFPLSIWEKNVILYIKGLLWCITLWNTHHQNKLWYLSHWEWELINMESKVIGPHKPTNITIHCIT